MRSFGWRVWCLDKPLPLGSSKSHSVASTEAAVFCFASGGKLWPKCAQQILEICSEDIHWTLLKHALRNWKSSAGLCSSFRIPNSEWIRMALLEGLKEIYSATFRLTFKDCQRSWFDWSFKLMPAVPSPIVSLLHKHRWPGCDQVSRVKSVTSMGSQCSNKTCRFGSFGSALQKLKRQHLGAAGVMKALLFHVHNWFGISKLLQAGGEMARGRKVKQRNIYCRNFGWECRLWTAIAIIYNFLIISPPLRVSMCFYACVASRMCTKWVPKATTKQFVEGSAESDVVGCIANGTSMGFFNVSSIARWECWSMLIPNPQQRNSRVSTFAMRSRRAST